MAERRKRILLYVPVVWPDDTALKIVALAKELAAVCSDHGDELTILATSIDLIGRPVYWPKVRTQFARVLPPSKLEPSASPEGSRAAFQQLTDLAEKHDLVWIPQPFGALPSDCRLQLSIPVVLGIPHLDFDIIDSGARTDRFRRDMLRLSPFARHFLFATTELQSAAVARCGIPIDRTSVVPDSGTRVYSSPDQVRALGLPERYLLTVGWDRPNLESPVTADAVADLFRRGRLPCPFVMISEGIDHPPLVGILQLQRGRDCRAKLEDAGMQLGRDWFELHHLEPQELQAVLAGATGFIGNGRRGAGPNWHTLSASRSRVPLINPTVVGYDSDPDRTFSYDPQSADSLADAILACFTGRQEATLRADVASRHLSKSNAQTLHRILSEQSQDRYPISHPPVRQARPRDQRVAWLISHTTLRDAEIPILRQLGYEVYTNKVLPAGDDYRSGSADFSWDDDSTLPTDVLQAMNAYNFYQSELTYEMTCILEAYFGTIISAVYGLLLRQLIKNYHGRILIRAFGLEAPRTYGEYFGHFSEDWMWKRLWQIQHRFWIAACYEQIPPHEPALLRHHSVILPVAMPERTFRMNDQWVGTDRRVFFVCPSIHSAAHYYGLIYEQFRKLYGDLPHLIGGAQSIPVDDPNVTGFLTEEQFNHILVDLRVMYYHSREPRHIHYHPLEAIAVGMPVVYMRGGLMEHFDTGSQAGACETDAEAHEKLRRILDGDTELIAAIRKSQKSILDIFLPGHNLAAWADVFSGDVMAESCIADLPSLAPFGVQSRAITDIPQSLVGVPFRELKRKDWRRTAELATTAPAVFNLDGSESLSPKQRIRELIPKPLRSSARVVFGGMKFLKRSMQRPVLQSHNYLTPAPLCVVEPTVIPIPLSPRELDAQYLHTPSLAPADRMLHENIERNLNVADIGRILNTDGWNFTLDPVGSLDPNLPIKDIERQKLIVGFSHLAWETEDACGPFTASACREAMLWCRVAEHAVFTSGRDRDLAIRRYRLDPKRTSILPTLTLMGGIPTGPDPVTKHTVTKYKLPETFLIGYYSKRTNPNSWLLLQAIRILMRRGVELPALVLTEAIKTSAAGRSSERVEIDTYKSLNSLGLVKGKNLFLFPALREERRRSLEVRACLSVVVPRWGGDAVRDVTRAALARVPVVASAILPVVDAFGGSGDNVLLVDPDDAVGLANSIRRTLEMNDETRARTGRALATAQRLNSPEVLAERERLFSAVAARASANEEVRRGSLPQSKAPQRANSGSDRD